MTASQLQLLALVIGGIVILLALARIVSRRRSAAVSSTDVDSPAQDDHRLDAHSLPPTEESQQADELIWKSSENPDDRRESQRVGQPTNPELPPATDPMDVPGQAILKDVGAGRSADVADQVAQRSDRAAAAGAVPDLFQSMRRKVDRAAGIPELEPHEVPGVADDDLVFGPITTALATMLPESISRRDSSRKELLGAGFYGPHAAINMAAIRYVGIIVPMLLMGAVLVLAPTRFEWMAIAGMVVLPLVCWSLPRIYIQNRMEERKTQIEQAMPDMLDMLNMCVSQGLTVPESLLRVGRELQPIYPALSQELRIVAEQSRVGTLEHALDNLSRRVDVPEVASFTSLLIQTERMGTSISQALAEYSDGIRTTLQQRADERGNRAAFQLLFPTVLCLMPAVYMVLLGPSILAMSEFVNGDGQGSRQQIQENLRNLQNR